jgi:hypothetical protein
MGGLDRASLVKSAIVCESFLFTTLYRTNTSKFVIARRALFPTKQSPRCERRLFWEKHPRNDGCTVEKSLLNSYISGVGVCKFFFRQAKAACLTQIPAWRGVILAIARFSNGTPGEAMLTKAQFAPWIHMIIT